MPKELTYREKARQILNEVLDKKLPSTGFHPRPDSDNDRFGDKEKSDE